VIHDVDETLKALIRRDVINGSSVEISFEAPTKEWAAKRTTPTINCYLYDIREDTGRRQVFFEDVRDETGRVVERRQPPRKFRLAYLLTAWTQRPEDEHRLLSTLLGCFLQQDFLPEELLVGSLQTSGNVVVSSIALPVGEDRQISEVWSALGGELKPSLDLSVVAPFDVGRAVPVGPPVTEAPRFSVARPDADAEVVQEARPKKGKGKGKSDDATDDEEAASGDAATTGADGERLVGVKHQPGIPGVTMRPAPAGPPGRLGQPARPGRPARPGQPVAASGESVPDETISAGESGDPGRVIRIRQWK